MEVTNPDHKAYYSYLLETYGAKVAYRYLEVVSKPPAKGKGGAWTRITSSRVTRTKKND